MLLQIQKYKLKFTTTVQNVASMPCHMKQKPYTETQQQTDTQQYMFTKTAKETIVFITL